MRVVFRPYFGQLRKDYVHVIFDRYPGYIACCLYGGLAVGVGNRQSGHGIFVQILVFICFRPGYKIKVKIVVRHIIDGRTPR